jgi:5-methylcytosine-specific restriction endonuclease McrA
MVYCKDTNETLENYSEYLHSNHWKLLKVRYRKSKLFKSGACSICGSYKRINIHHKSYIRIGNERLSDLMVLCQDCHHKLHKAYNGKVSSHINLWTMAKHMRCKQRSVS